MMKMVLTAMATMFALGLAGPVLAQETGAGSAAAGHPAMHPSHNARQGAEGANGQHRQAMHLAGAHSMTGTITSINHRTGLIGFQTPEGALRIHFPPGTIRHLRSGETITVYLGYEPGHGTHGRMGE